MRSLGILVLLFAVSSPGYASKPQHGTMVHLFEWRWTDIARECEQFLGKTGYTAIQVSPPQEHAQGAQWYSRYQPVSYKLESRSGSRSEFIDMVRRCKAVGVDIYVDAVINHMASVGRGVGFAGTAYTEYNYPGVPYSSFDFHFCGRPFNDIKNYSDAYEVRNCELVNLADLALEKDYVRGKVANYLNDLIGIGVAGFRYDAAKHMLPADLAAIRSRLTGNPYIFQEVIDQSDTEAIRASEYFGIGDVTEFRYGLRIGDNIGIKGRMRYLKTFGEAWDLMPSDKAVVFLSNHDNERPGHGGGGNVLSFKDGQRYEIANVFMLAWPYGYPKVMSSYQFGNDGNRGPPISTPYSTGQLRCGATEEWICQHRWQKIAGMVQLRKVAGNSSVGRWWNRGDTIAFARGDRAFVVINRENFAVTESFPTDLQPGAYCNVLLGWDNGVCTAPYVPVGKDGKISITVGSLSAAAFHIGAKIVSNFPSMFLRGSFNNWAAGTPMVLVGNYTWVAASVSFAGNLNPQFKFDVFGNWMTNFGDDNGDQIADRAGKDIPVKTEAGNYRITFNDSSLRYSIAAV